jgi:hypothetical protein
MAIPARTAPVVTGRVLQDVSKPSYDELLERLAALEAEKEAQKGEVSFVVKKNDKGKLFGTFKHGLSKEAWPVSTTPAVWRVILANIKMIESKLPKA